MLKQIQEEILTEVRKKERKSQISQTENASNSTNQTEQSAEDEENKKSTGETVLSGYFWIVRLILGSSVNRCHVGSSTN